MLAGGEYLEELDDEEHLKVLDCCWWRILDLEVLDGGGCRVPGTIKRWLVESICNYRMVAGGEYPELLDGGWWRVPGTIRRWLVESTVP
jgi:hypothetical protein